MLPYLSVDSPFPSVDSALDEPDGLLAAGGDLSVNRLVSAYSSGIFPWFNEGEPILWWSPNPRTIFEIRNYQPSKSLCRFVRKSSWKVTLNNAFDQVITSCAAPRKDSFGTWITNDIIEAYNRLHKKGYAHSVEVWQDNILVGGIYGIAIGKIFCGESMFSKKSQASKVALSCLIAYLNIHQFPILDAQIKNPHLTSLGAIQIERSLFINAVSSLKEKFNDPLMWQAKALNFQKLISRK